MKHGFIKVAAAAPDIKVADTVYNAQRTIDCIHKAQALGVKLLVLPELSLTGRCYDLIGHRVLLDGAQEGLGQILAGTQGIDMLVLVGLPVAAGARVFSCAAALYQGRLLGLVPRSAVDGSHFAPPPADPIEVELCGQKAVLAAELLLEHRSIPGLTVGVELGEDLFAPLSPAMYHALDGASLICRMAGFPETVSSTDEAMEDLRCLSRRLRCAMVLSAPGKGETTTDNVFSGLCAVAENGQVLAQDEREDSLAVTEVDMDLILQLRRRSGLFASGEDRPSVLWGGALEETELTRPIPRHPHLPQDPAKLPEYCRRMLDIQVNGLKKRMRYAGLTHCVIGISGGVDSTLAVLVSAQAVKELGYPPENVVACTMPCFGTSSRTKNNAIVVAQQLGAEVRIIDISKAVYQHFEDIGHARDDYSIAYENAQARERTQVLMDIANKVNGLNVGTEDLSEFVDGWCTYNGDHTSMYDVNLGLTKTQVRANVDFIARNTEDEILKAALLDVLDCPVTPELLPIHDDKIEQKSEDAVGSYSLQDFFTHMIMIRGFAPSKTLRLAQIAYGRDFTREELVRWLTSYCKRYFSQQFKRSCLMDGPAVEDFTVSPRTGFLIPSDGENTLFLKDLNEKA